MPLFNDNTANPTLIYTKVADQVIAYSPSTSTAYFSVSIPANTLVAGDIIRVTTLARSISGNNSYAARLTLGSATAENSGVSMGSGVCAVLQSMLLVRSTTSLMFVPSGLGTSTSSILTFDASIAQPLTVGIRCMTSAGSITATSAIIEVLRSR